MQKEIANIIFEHFTTMLILGENPLTVDIGHKALSSQDLRKKYAPYLNPPEELTRTQRGLLAMHYLAMHSQVWDDNEGKYADMRFGILNPATQMLAQGSSPEEIEWRMGELGENYRQKAEALNVHPFISSLVGDGTKYGMPCLHTGFKIGSNVQGSPLQAMRIAMAREGYYAPPK